MTEWKLFRDDDLPPWIDPAKIDEWYSEREHAPHIDQGIHQPRLWAAARMVLERIGDGEGVCDLGAGDGGLLQFIREQGNTFGKRIPVWGYDLQPSNLEAAARRDVDVRSCNVVTNRSWRAGDVVICTEFLEHLQDPHTFVGEVYDRGPRLFVASSPANESDRSHYAYHTWAWDTQGYKELLEQGGWKQLEVWTDGIFQVHCCGR